MSWDPFQRAVLAELGHVLYRPARQAPSMIVPMAAEAVLLRLARAASVELAELMRHPDIVEAAARLGGDGAAKRALWPRLRGLRRG